MDVATSQSSPRDDIPVAEYVRGNFVPLSHLTHGWELHSALPLTPAEERTMVREPAQAVPASIAERLGKLRVLVVPYVLCLESGAAASFVSTVAEYMHGLWHDVQIRVGPEHLPVPQLRRRMTLMSEMFPPNTGYRIFSEELEKQE